MKRIISDEEALKKGFQQNMGMYLVAGTSYRTTVTNWIRFVSFSIGESLFFLGCFGATILSTDDLTLLFENLHWTLIGVTALSSIPISFPNRHRYDRIFTTFGKDVYTYSYIDEETNLKIRKLRAQCEKEKNHYVKILTSMIWSTVFCFAIATPLLSLYSGEFFKPQRNDGVITGLCCNIWFPIKIDESWIVQARTGLMLAQIYLATTVAMVLLGQQGTAICIGHKILYEFQIIALAMETFDGRAQWAYKRNHGQRARPKDPKIGVYLRHSLKEAIIHHNILINVAEDFRGIFFITEVVLLLVSTLLICLSAISLVSDIPLEGKAIMVIFSGTELASVFVECYYGQVLLDGHSVIREGLYRSNWMRNSATIGKDVMIIQSRLQKPLSLSAGGFVDVNLDTYAQVVKSSFSYFSILQAASG